MFVPGVGATSVYAIEIIYGTTDDDTLDGGDGNDTVSYADDPGGSRSTSWPARQSNIGDASGSKTTTSSRPTVSPTSTPSLGLRRRPHRRRGGQPAHGGGSNNTVTGGGGNDAWSSAGGSVAINVDMSTWSTTTPTLQPNSFGGFDTISGFENVIAGEGDDIITGDDDDNVLTGRAGEDIVFGGGGFDTVAYADGTQGIDIDLWAEVDGVRSGRWTDGFGDADTVDRTSVEAYRGTSADDQMKGDGGGQFSALAQAVFFGEDGDDTLFGSGLDDQLDGGDGDDSVEGFGGDDVLTGGDGDDLLVAAGNQAQLTMKINVGGPALDDWRVDTASSPSPQLEPGATTIVSTTTATVIYDATAVNGAPAAIFDVGRYSVGNMNWEIPLYGAGTYPETTGGGSYTVNLYLVEGYRDFTTAGERVFDVSVEGVVPTIFDDIDPWVLGGCGNDGKATRPSFCPTRRR